MGLSKDKELLRVIIMEHYDNPNNKIDDESNYQNYKIFHNKSSTCIDDIKILINISNNKIIDAKFLGIGCAISTSSTDIICEMLIDKSVNDAIEIIDNYKKMINNKEYDEDNLGELIAFYQIHLQSNRIKCAMIGADAFIKVLEENNIYEK